MDLKSHVKHDDYMTPKSAWEDIKEFIPKNKILWEAFYGNGDSGRYLRELGFDVIQQDIDFFNNDKGDVIISNPPFSKTKEVLTRMLVLDKPFILIMPSSKINTQYFKKLFSENENKIQIIIPKHRIHFVKLVNGEKPKDWKNACYFDCFYYCWKMNLPEDILFLQ